MKYLVIFLSALFSGYLSFAMNSTENRNLIVDIDLALKSLKQEQSQGDIVSGLAYEIYRDRLRGFVPINTENKQACDKLIALGLCRIEQGKLRPIEYFVDDRLLVLERKSRMIRGYTR